jgi:hypothetical protein
MRFWETERQSSSEEKARNKRGGKCWLGFAGDLSFCLPNALEATDGGRTSEIGSHQVVASVFRWAGVRHLGVTPAVVG